MAPLTAAQVAALQRKPDAVRNICILAHIDHGTEAEAKGEAQGEGKRAL